MILKFDLKKFLVSLLIPIAVGGLSAFITRNDMDIYKTINRPPLSPPSVVFPVAWSILYILLGISFYLVWNSDHKYYNKTSAYFFFICGLIFNFLWSPIFFSAKLYLFAFFILLLLLVSIIVMIIEFYKISKPAAYLQIPYLLWLLFAGYLNIGIYLLNK